jgi:hypothetical protein
LSGAGEAQRDRLRCCCRCLLSGRDRLVVVVVVVVVPGMAKGLGAAPIAGLAGSGMRLGEEG